MSSELNPRIQRFLQSFELVFHIDWARTKSCILDENSIREDGTFIDRLGGDFFTATNEITGRTVRLYLMPIANSEHLQLVKAYTMQMMNFGNNN